MKKTLAILLLDIRSYPKLRYCPIFIQCFLMLTCVFFAGQATAQNSIDLNINQEKLVIDKDLQTALFKTIDENATILIKQSAVDVKKEFYKQMAQQLDSTINHLDNTPHLKDFYIALWGNKMVTIEQEMKTLDDFCKNYCVPIPQEDFTYIISPKDLAAGVDIILTTAATQTKTTIDRRFHQFQIDIFRPDILKTWLLTYYNSLKDMNLLSDLTVDELRHEMAIIADLNMKIAKIQPITCDYNNDDITFITHALPDLKLLSDLKDGIFYQKLIWINRGTFKFDPFIADTLYDKTKADLFNKKVSDELAKTCCLTDLQKLKALIKSQQTGRDSFMTGTKAIAFGFKNMEDLQNSKGLVNRILIPFSDPEWKQKRVLAYSFDNFSTPKKYRGLAIPENESLSVGVYNIPSGNDITFTSKNAVVSDQSKITDAFNSATSSFGDALSSVIGLGISFEQPTYPLKDYVMNNKAEGFEIGLSAVEVTSLKSIKFYKEPKGALKVDKSFSLTLNGIALGVDNWESIDPETILDDYLQLKLKDKPEILEKAQSFEQPYMDCLKSKPKFSYHDQEKAKVVLQNFVNRFKDFALINEKREALLTDDLNNDFIIIGYLAQFNQIYLPKKTYALNTVNTPKFHTQLSSFDETNPPQQITYTVTQNTKGNAKGDTVIGIRNYRVGKRYWVLASAGAAFTFKSYISNDATVTGNQVTINNEYNNARFVAGLNFYFLGLFQMDESFMGLSSHRAVSRLSLFTGLGIPDPLKNFYIGLSDDIFPGIHLTVGPQFIRYAHTQIDNDQIYDHASTFKYVGVFSSLTIDPVSLVKMITAFK
jgi:hypothetical protein